MQDDININILTGLEKITQVFRALLWEMAKKEGISPLQLQFMDYIQRSPRELCTVSRMSAEFDLKKSTVSESIKALQAKNLVGKEKSRDDKRYFYLFSTSMGIERVSSLNYYSPLLMKELEKIPADNRKTVLSFLTDIIRLFYEHGFIQTAKLCINCRNFVPNSDKSSDRPHFCTYAGIHMRDDGIKFNCRHFNHKI